jgi:hypothetical protein
MTGDKKHEMQKAVWSTAYVNDLPDAAFAVIESGGTKDQDGKTTPRTLRHLPHHNAGVTSGGDNTTVDLPHLRNGLARCKQLKDVSLRSRAERHLRKHADKLLHKSIDGAVRVRGVGEITKYANANVMPKCSDDYCGIDMVRMFGGKGNLDFKEGDTGIGVIQTHELGLLEQQTKLTESFGWDPIVPDEDDIAVLSDLLGYDVHNYFDFEFRAPQAMAEELREAGFRWDSSKNVWTGSGSRVPPGYRGKYVACWLSRCDLDLYFAPDIWEDLSEVEQRVLAKYCPIDIHTDIRLAARGAAYWEGGECGTPYNQFRVNGLRDLSDDPDKHGEWMPVNLQSPVGDEVSTPADEVIRGSLEWMVVGSDAPQTLSPGTVGAPGGWARLTVRDTFTWRAGEQSDTRKEFWFEGGMMKGRWILELYPRDPNALTDNKFWTISKPKDQTPPAVSDDSDPTTVTKQDDAYAFEYFITKMEITEPTKRLVTGVVLEPDTPDAQGDIYNEEEVEKAAHGYMSRYRISSEMGEMHKSTTKKIEVVESWLQREPAALNGQPVKKGSWLITVKVNKDDAWEKVKSGEYRGFSIGGTAKGQLLT